MENTKLYRPSNGTEGRYFIDEYCMQCINCDPDPNGEKQCKILCASLCHNTNEPEYPGEWTYDGNKPICTSHVYWDWGKDGDPDNPENPKAPPPYDPRQLVFPFLSEQLESILSEGVLELSTKQE